MGGGSPRCSEAPAPAPYFGAWILPQCHVPTLAPGSGCPGVSGALHALGSTLRVYFRELEPCRQQGQ